MTETGITPSGGLETLPIAQEEQTASTPPKGSTMFSHQQIHDALGHMKPQMKKLGIEPLAPSEINFLNHHLNFLKTVSRENWEAVAGACDCTSLVDAFDAMPWNPA